MAQCVEVARPGQPACQCRLATVAIGAATNPRPMLPAPKWTATPLILG
jgi:hypothetical protein